jgi:hypothetical protein
LNDEEEEGEELLVIGDWLLGEEEGGTSNIEHPTSNIEVGEEEEEVLWISG